MLLACRLAGLSAYETHYAGVVTVTQSEREYAARGGLIRFSDINSATIDLKHER
jgi:hypothetical protein